MTRNEETVRKNIRAALEHDPRVNLHHSRIAIDGADGDAVLDGEVAAIEEKRAAVERAKTVAGVTRVTDRLRVRPSAPLGDGTIRDAVCRHLMEEPALLRMAVSCRVEGDADVIARRPDQADGSLDATVGDGVVTLQGKVWSRAHKRLATVLAWWAPGCRDVVNEIDVTPVLRNVD